MPNALAQNEKQKADLTGLDIEELMEVEIVTGASKFAQKVTDAPASITVITAEEIRRFGYRTLTDVLASVKGFYVSYDRNYAYVGVRGFSRPEDYNSRLLLMINGHRVNENIYDSVYYETAFPVDIDLIEQIEIIRGPSSSLYGTNAFFGVINIITKKGEAFHGLEVSTDAGSLQTYRGRISYGDQFANGLGLLLSGTFYDSKGNRRLYYKEFDMPETNNGIAEDADYDRFHNFFGNLSFGNFTVAGVYSAREKGIPTAAFETRFNDRRNNTRDSFGYADLRYERNLSSGFHLTGRAYYDQYIYSGDLVYQRSADEAPTTYIAKDAATGRQWGSEFTLAKNLAQKHKLTFGTEFRHNFQQDQDNFAEDTGEIYLAGRRASHIHALYAQDEFAISKKLLLNVGLRFDRYSTFGSTVNPRLALIVNPFKKTWFKMLYGQAFRAPNVFELFYGDSAIQKPALNLKPETIKTTEAVFEQYLGNHVRLSASGYFYHIHSLISQQIDPLDNLIVFRNADHIKARGIELEIEAKMKRLESKASFVYQKTEDERLGDDLVNSPRQQAYFNLSLPLWKETLYSSLDVRFTGERKTALGIPADGYWMTNLTLLKQRLGHGWELSFSLYNLFDQKYSDPVGEELRQNTITQDGRRFRVKLSYGFGKKK
ncbi:MAG: TonB-dependent receptor [Acidobacteriota bacterium]